MAVSEKKWERVYQFLLAYIDENKFSGNLKLPSENALCRRLDVSRDTVPLRYDTASVRGHDLPASRKRHLF